MSTQVLTRRQFLVLGAAGVGAAIGPTLLTGCGPLPALAPLTGASPGGLPYTPTDAIATVAAARGRDLAAITREALERLGGIGQIVRPGHTVFIKPNLLTAGLGRANATATGEITKVEIVIAAAEECLKAGASQVTIGDGSQVAQFDWAELKTLDGESDMVQEAARLNATYGQRVSLACLNVDSPEWDPVPAPRSNLGEILVSSLVTRADRIISIPVLKTHHIARLSLSLKNFMGVMPISKYGGGSEAIGRYKLHRATGGPQTAFMDVVDALRPDLAIIDGSICCEGYGPWVRPRDGKTVDMRDRLGDWLVLASTDPVAADCTAARIVGQDYTQINYLSWAYDQGLGQALEDHIMLAGATLDELRVPWKPA